MYNLATGADLTEKFSKGKLNVAAVKCELKAEVTVTRAAIVEAKELH
ncbi:hypothetical protein Q7M76_02660 [Candidatus Liberibacter asiaticus]|uniref:Uncharacterized protein n=2 Tax=Liberibacter asiaticus TaxID=34021 RepID=C6XFI8_LIBAP|nr:hypothetical protein [Candidatus Liberibacter asiaticus]ACT57141.1 hypothetical protein CLIBASIA_02775 [Candidatus Liberibacter asiaticus str. psy62]AGH16896.1 hypothetical protein WSI_02630 [Candidatus Liberibacter asiaticus str. gxpsy]MBE2996556.1 hypothetical protein [Candidatus Liberibacter asiaticus]MCU7487816.1 hypothetical protein [Candidatus Liberibacter asiaticus]MCU7488846.1 hypothetical protein [Candidatus Liberibacter asiaticus]